MASWQVSGHARTPAPMPFGLSRARLIPRLGAWLVDGIVFALLGLIPLTCAALSGGLGANPEATRQLEANSTLSPTVPLLVVNTGVIVAWAALWVAAIVLFSAVCWTHYRGLPGQRLLSLEVADARTGQNLALPRALLRAVLLNGIPAVGLAVVLVVVAQMMAAINPANIGVDSESQFLESHYDAVWRSVVSVCSLGIWVWPLFLLISVAGGGDRRAFHDRVSGSIVLGRAIAYPAWGGAYAQAPWAQYGAQFGPGPAYGPGNPPPSGTAGVPLAGQPPVTQPPEAWPGLAQPGGPMAPWGPPPPPAVRPDVAKKERELARSEREKLQVFGAKLPEGLRIAGRNRRIGAYAMDTIVVLGLFLGFASALYGNVDPRVTPPPERLVMLAGLLAGLAQAVYFVAGWRLMRASFGQKLLGLQVGDESTGNSLGWVDALVRWAVLQGPMALYLAVPDVVRVVMEIAAIGWIWLLFYSSRSDPDGRGYHDRIARSLVVEHV